MTFQRMMYFYLSATFISVLGMVLVLPACGEARFDIYESEGADDSVSGSGGGGNVVLELPVQVGASLMCVQGVGGTYSHSSESTYYGLDLDTSNYADEEVYAVASGVAYVHAESATSGFGYYVIIDLGNGTYVVIAHLDEIFIADGTQVVVGQLIGYEGCTGYCSGDHIHVGLLEGDASQPADQGVSIPVSYRAADASEYGSVATIESEDFVCGIRAEGDPQDGHFYESALEVPLWHPDGTLVKTGNNSKTYVIDDGDLSWIENEGVFWSLNYDFDEVVIISDEELDCYGNTSSITSESYIHAVKDTDDDVWLIVGESDDSDSYRQRVNATGWQGVLASWGLSYSSTSQLDSESGLSGWSMRDGYAFYREGTLVSESSRSDVYAIMNSTALPVHDWETYLLAGFVQRTVLTVDDGDVASIMNEVGSCSADVLCLDQTAFTVCGGGLEVGEGEFGGSIDDDQDDEVDEEESTEQEDEEEEQEDEVDEEEDEEEEEEDETESSSGDCGGDDACLADLDGDGMNETLLMGEDLWISSSVNGLPAFVWAYGNCFDGSLDTSDLMYENDGYYEIDFSYFASDCTAELTLISSVGMDGSSPDSYMSNWYWWQNEDFCAAGSMLCQLMDNDTSWEEWLIAVSWDPDTGLLANGNGFTSNEQL